MQLPGPVRAAVGLIAVAADEAKHLPDRAIELPMLAVSTALQMSLRAQQRYARLAARGDDVLHRRPISDEPPAWATFDDPVLPAEPIDPDPVASPPVKRAPKKAATRPATKADVTKATPADGADPAPTRKPGKTISPPRNGAPSAFDTVDDD